VEVIGESDPNNPRESDPWISTTKDTKNTKRKSEREYMNHILDLFRPHPRRRYRYRIIERKSPFRPDPALEVLSEDDFPGEVEKMMFHKERKIFT